MLWLCPRSANEWSVRGRGVVHDGISSWFCLPGTLGMDRRARSSLHGLNGSERGEFGGRVGLLTVMAEALAWQVMAFRACEDAMLPGAFCYYYFYTLPLRPRAVITKRTCFTLRCITSALSRSASLCWFLFKTSTSHSPSHRHAHTHT